MTVNLKFLLLASFMLTAGAPAQTTLKEAYQNDFLIGCAVNSSQFEEQDLVESDLIKKQFNSITAENAMKWDAIQPVPGEYNFTSADRFVKFGCDNHMEIDGATLIWHSQVPDWVFRDELGKVVDRDTLLKRMRNYIHEVVGRYKGRIHSWGVVNEALADDGSLRDTPWLQIIGKDYIEKAFGFAHEADPQAQLYYNDYGIESGGKRDAAINLLKGLKEKMVPITGVGLQGHMNLEFPPILELDKTIGTYGRLGLKVMITELDVDMLPSPWALPHPDVNQREEARPELDPYREFLPKELEKRQAERYEDLFNVFVKHAGVVSRVTLWGVTDKSSWLNDFPIQGRRNYPLLFDRQGLPKPAFYKVIKLPGDSWNSRHRRSGMP